MREETQFRGGFGCGVLWIPPGKVNPEAPRKCFEDSWKLEVNPPVLQPGFVFN